MHAPGSSTVVNLEIEMKSHEIEIACNHTEASKFVNWLLNQGHTASVGLSTGNYIDNVWTSTNEEANRIMSDLWTKYCNS